MSRNRIDRAVSKPGSADVIIVGGGIYGAMLALEATRRGLAPLLLEREDYGGGTTHNNLRIVHGGLRYLQSADLPRFYESVAERRWFLRHFPDLVTPLGCVMPLDGHGARRSWLMGPALLANDLLSMHRNAGVAPDHRLGAGHIVAEEEVHRRFPAAARAGHTRAALWYDAFAPNMHRLVMEVIHWARRHGAEARNYMQVDGLMTDAGRVCGVRATDQLTGEVIEISAPLVVNAAGPGSRAFSAAAGDERPELFTGAVAWNVLYDRPALSADAVAVASPKPGSQVLFCVPWKGRLLAGTGHAPCRDERTQAVPDEHALLAFTESLNEAVPELKLGLTDMERVFSGLLPTTRSGSDELTQREVVIDHAASDGPRGFFSLSGIKFTTARRVADHVLARAVPSRRATPWADFDRPAAQSTRRSFTDHDWHWMPKPDDDEWLNDVRALAAEEDVVHVDDLLLRRTALADNPRRGIELAGRVATALGMDAATQTRECARVHAQLRRGLEFMDEGGSGAKPMMRKH